jgi:arsenate reductase-like glutaredoxin family protein
MPKTKILQEGQSYTFRSYFEMPYEADQILGELGYLLVRSRLLLPKSEKQLEQLSELQQRLEDTLLLISLSNETARREALVFPVLLEVARFCQSQIRIEYPLTVNPWLKGNLDYLLRGENTLLVVEAKNDDLSRGFTQLATELIALAQAEDQNILYGAVTIGDAWRFGRLESSQKTIAQDITLYRIPDDLEELTRILIGILTG